MSDDPYEASITRLLEILNTESPMCKLEYIYNACTQSIKEELDAFWIGYKIKETEL